MAVHTFFLHLMLILLTARIFGEVAARLRSPPVVGELLAGVLLGPSLLGWIEPSDMVKMLAEVGILLLLFEVGLETDVRRLMHAGRQAMLVATMGFILPFVMAFGVSRYGFGMEVLPAMFVGGTLTATSIGITVRVLTDLGRQHDATAQVVLGAAVIDDVFGVVLLALLYEFSQSGGASYSHAGRIMLFIGVFFVVAPLLAKVISSFINRFEAVSCKPGLIPSTVVSLVLFFAWLAHEIGAPELLGGFAAGLALSRRFFLPFAMAIHQDTAFAQRIDEQMRPIVHLFTPIFFVMVGLSLDLSAVQWSDPFIWSFSGALLALAVVGKLAGALLIGESWPARVVIGVAMVPRGEVGLIFAELGQVSGIIPNDIYAALIIVIALTTLLPPFAMKWLYNRYNRYFSVNPEIWR